MLFCHFVPFIRHRVLIVNVFLNYSYSRLDVCFSVRYCDRILRLSFMMILPTIILSPCVVPCLLLWRHWSAWLVQQFVKNILGESVCPWHDTVSQICSSLMCHALSHVFVSVQCGIYANYIKQNILVSRSTPKILMWHYFTFCICFYINLYEYPSAGFNGNQTNERILAILVR